MTMDGDFLVLKRRGAAPSAGGALGRSISSVHALGERIPFRLLIVPLLPH